MLVSHPIFSCYGVISNDFKIFAKIVNELEKIRETEQSCLDCYEFSKFSSPIRDAVQNKISQVVNGLTTIEIFIPSRDYPNHVDEGGLSFFIPLEDCGYFTSGGIRHKVNMFNLYSFDDGVEHNTDVACIMIKLIEDSFKDL